MKFSESYKREHYQIQKMDMTGYTFVDSALLYEVDRSIVIAERFDDKKSGNFITSYGLKLQWDRSAILIRLYFDTVLEYPFIVVFEREGGSALSGDIIKTWYVPVSRNNLLDYCQRFFPDALEDVMETKFRYPDGFPDDETILRSRRGTNEYSKHKEPSGIEATLLHLKNEKRKTTDDNVVFPHGDESVHDSSTSETPPDDLARPSKTPPTSVIKGVENDEKTQLLKKPDLSIFDMTWFEMTHGDKEFRVTLSDQIGKDIITEKIFLDNDQQFTKTSITRFFIDTWNDLPWIVTFVHIQNESGGIDIKKTGKVFESKDDMIMFCRKNFPNSVKDITNSSDSLW